MELKMYSSLLVLGFIIPFATLSAQSEGSCVGRCGEGYFRGDSCHCDYNCMSYMECCQDYKAVCTTEGSCKGRCHEGFIRGQACDCDSSCVSYGKCCPDYESSCVKPTQRQPSPPPSPRKPIPDARDNSPEPTKKTDDGVPEDIPEDHIQRDEAVPEKAKKMLINKKDPSKATPNFSLSSPKKTTKRSPRRPQKKNNVNLIPKEEKPEDPSLESSPSFSSVKKTRKRSPRRPGKKTYGTFIYPEDDEEDPNEGKSPSPYHKKSPPKKNKNNPINSAPKKPRKKKKRILVEYEDEPEDTNEDPSSPSSAKSPSQSKNKKLPKKVSKKSPKTPKKKTLVESEEEIQESEENVSSSSFSSSSSSTNVKGSKTTKKLSRKKNKPQGEDDKPDADTPESDTTEPNLRHLGDKDDKTKKPNNSKTKETDDNPENPEKNQEPNESRLNDKDDKSRKPKIPNTKEGNDDPGDPEKPTDEPNQRHPGDKDDKPKKNNNPTIKEDGDNPENPETNPDPNQRSPDDKDSKPTKPKTPKEKDGDDPEDQELPPGEPSLERLPESPRDIKNKPKKTKPPKVEEVTEDDTEVNKETGENTFSSSLKNTRKRSPANTNKNPKKPVNPKGNTDDPSQKPSPSNKRKKRPISKVPNKRKKKVLYSDEDIDEPSKPGKGKNPTKKSSPKDKIKRKKKIDSKEERQETVESEFSSSSQSSTSHSRSKSSSRRLKGKNNKNLKEKNKKKIPDEPEEPLMPPKRRKDKDFLPTPEPTFRDEGSGDDGSGMDFLPTTMAATTLMTHFTTTESQTKVETKQTEGTVNPSIKPQTESIDVTSYKPTPSTPNLVSTEGPEKTSTTTSSYIQSSTPKEKIIALSTATDTPVQQSKNSRNPTVVNDSETSVIMITSIVTENINEASTEPPQHGESTVEQLQLDTKVRHNSVNPTVYTDMTKTDITTNNGEKRESDIGSTMSSGINRQLAKGTTSPSHSETTEEVNKEKSPYPINKDNIEGTPAGAGPTMLPVADQNKELFSETAFMTTRNINITTTLILESTDNIITKKSSTEDVIKTVEAIITHEQPNPPSMNPLLINPETTILPTENLANDNTYENIQFTEGKKSTSSTVGPSADNLSVNVFNMATVPTDTQHFLSTAVVKEEYKELLHALIETPSLEQNLTEATNNLTTGTQAEYSLGFDLTTVDPTKQLLVSTVGENGNTYHILSTHLNDEPLPIHSGVTNTSSDSTTWAKSSSSMISTETNAHIFLSTLATTEQIRDPLSLKTATPYIDRVSTLDVLQTLPAHLPTFAESMNVNEKQNATQLVGVTSPQTIKEQTPTTTTYINRNNTAPLTDDLMFTNFAESTNLSEATADTNTNNTLTAISTEKSMTYTIKTVAPTEFKTSPDMVKNDNARQSSSKSETPSLSGTVNIPKTSHMTGDDILLTETDTDHVVISNPTTTDKKTVMETTHRINTDQLVATLFPNIVELLLTASTEVTDSEAHDIVTHSSKANTEAQTEDNTVIVARETSNVDTIVVTEDKIKEHFFSSTTTDPTSLQAAKTTDQLQTTLLSKELGAHESTVDVYAEGMGRNITLSPTNYNSAFPTDHKTRSSLVTGQGNEILNITVTVAKESTVLPNVGPTGSLYITPQILKGSETTIITKADILPTQNPVLLNRSDVDVVEITQPPETQPAPARASEYLSSSATLGNITPKQFAERESTDKTQTTYMLKTLTEGPLSTVAPREPIGIDNDTPVPLYHYTDFTPIIESRPYTFLSRENTSNILSRIPSIGVGLEELVLVNETSSTQKPMVSLDYTFTTLDNNITSNIVQTVTLSSSNTVQTTLLNITEKQSTDDLQTTIHPNELYKVELSTDAKDEEKRNHITASLTESINYLSSTEQTLHTSKVTNETNNISSVTVTPDVSPDITVSGSEATSQTAKQQTPSVTIKTESFSGSTMQYAISSDVTEWQHASHLDSTSLPYDSNIELLSKLAINQGGTGQSTLSHINDTNSGATPTLRTKDTSVSNAVVAETIDSNQSEIDGHTISIQTVKDSTIVALVGITDNQFNFTTSDTVKLLETTENQRADLLPTDPLPKEEIEEVMRIEVRNRNNTETFTSKIPGAGVTSTATTSATINPEKSSPTTQHTDQSIGTSLLNVFNEEEQPTTTTIQIVENHENMNTMLPSIGDIYAETTTNMNNNIVTEKTGANNIPNLTVTGKVSGKDILYQTAGLETTKSTQKPVDYSTMTTTRVNTKHTTQIQDITLLPSKKPTGKDLASTPEGTEDKSTPITVPKETNTNNMSSVSSIPLRTSQINTVHSTLLVTETESNGTLYITQLIETPDQLSREQSKRTPLSTDTSEEQLSPTAISSRISPDAASAISPTYPMVSNGATILIHDGTSRVAVSTEQLRLSAGQMSTTNDVSTVFNTISVINYTSIPFHKKVKEKTTTVKEKSPISRMSLTGISREQLTGTSSMAFSLRPFITRQTITVQPTFVTEENNRELNNGTSSIVSKELIVTTKSTSGLLTTVLDTDSSNDQSPAVTKGKGIFSIMINENRPLTTQLTNQGGNFPPLDMKPSSTEGDFKTSTVATTKNIMPSSTAFKLLDKQLSTSGTTKENVLHALPSIETRTMSTIVSENASRPTSLTTLHRIVSPRYSPVHHTTHKIHRYFTRGSTKQGLDKMNNTDQNVTMNVTTTSLIKSSVTKTKHVTYNLHAPSFNFTVSTLKTPKDQSTTDSIDTIHTTNSETLQESMNTMPYNSKPVDPTTQTPLKIDNDKYTTSKQTPSAEYSTTTPSGQTDKSFDQGRGTTTKSHKMDHSTTNTNMMVYSTTATPLEMLNSFENQTQVQTKKTVTERDITVGTETSTRHSDHTSPKTTIGILDVHTGKSTTEQSVKLTTEQPEESTGLLLQAKSTVHQEERSTPTKSTIYDTTTKHVSKVDTKTPVMSIHTTKTQPTGSLTIRPTDTEEMENNIKTTKPHTVDPFHVCDLLKDEAMKLRISDNDLQHLTEICTEMQQQHPLVSTPSSETKQPNVNDRNIPPRYTYVTSPNLNQQPGSRMIQILEEIYRRMNISPLTNLTRVPGQNIHKPTAWLLLLNKIKSSNDPLRNLCIGQPADGMTTLQNGSMVVFRGNYFWMLNQGGVTESPRKISEVWGIPSPIDTVFTRCNCGGKTFFFKGPNYWRFTNDVMDHGYPKEIVKGFGGLRGRVTAVLPVTGFKARPESVYFFKTGGNVQKYTFQQEQSKRCTRKKRPSVQYPIYSQKVQTVRYRFLRDTVQHRIQIHRTFTNVQQPLGILHEETSVRSTWRGVPSNIISAVSLPKPEKQDGFDYFVFTKEKYYNINMSSKVAVKPPPESEQKTSKDWYKCT